MLKGSWNQAFLDSKGQFVMYFETLLKCERCLGVVANLCDPSTQETETKRL